MTSRTRVEAWGPVVLALLAGAIYVGSAGIPALLDDADSFYAEVAREMNLRGDWITPYANGIRYLEKPPLFFWLISASYGALRMAGSFTARLPTALAVTALVLLTYRIGSLLFGRRAGLLGGLALATSMGMFLFTRIILPDALFTLLLSAILYSYLKWKREGRRDAWIYWMYGFAGLAVMAKGLIGLVFPAGILFLALAIDRNWSDILRLISLRGVLLMLVVAAPWHILIGMRNPGFFWFYFINEHVLRFLGKRYPMDYGTVPLVPFWLLHLVWLFPWSIFLASLLDPRSFRRRLGEHGPDFWLPVAWALTILLFFSFSSRLEYYTVPAFPALALLCGAQLSSLWEEGRKWPGRLLGIVGGAAGISLLAAALAASAGSAQGWPGWPGRLGLKDNPELYVYYLGHLFDLTPESILALRLPMLVAALALGLLLPLHVVFRRWEARAAALGLGMGIFFVAANIGFSIFAPRLTSKTVADAINARTAAGDDPAIVIDGEYEEGCSVAFYTRRQVMLHNGRSSNLEYGSRYADSPRVFPDDESLKAIWADTSRRVFLVTFEPKVERLEALLSQNRHLLMRYGDKLLYSNRPD